MRNIKFSKIVLLLIIFLFFINIVNAELLINPTTISVSTNTNVEKVYEINITNSYDFDIFNIEFSDVQDVKFTNIQQLKSQESILANFTVRTTNTYNIQNTSKITFSYYDTITNPINQTEINITYSGFSPAYISIIKGSNIKFI